MNPAVHGHELVALLVMAALVLAVVVPCAVVYVRLALKGGE